MSGLTTSERVRIVIASARKSGVRASGTLWRLPVLRWRYGLPIADRFVLVPRDLRVADPSFAGEINLGHLGLAGRMAYLEGHSPFAVRAPNRSWERELHGFSWLRHLHAARTDDAAQIASDWVRDWVLRNKSKKGIAWEPDVLGRRITSWICHVPMLLEAASQSDYDLITDSLGTQLVDLSSRWREADNGMPRLQALIALLQAMLCVYGHDGEVNAAQDALFDELKKQLLPDGGHISRNPAVLIELLLDLLPLRQCYVARQVNVPDQLHGAITSLMSMLHHMRLGDGTIARFNGMGATPLDELATVLAYDYEPAQSTKRAVLAQSQYVRLTSKHSVVLIDAGGPPPWSVGGRAQAGCLSFEFSTGRVPLLVNCGMPGPSYRSELEQARSTAAHNTLAIKGVSSGSLVRSDFLKSQAGDFPIRSPAHVTARTQVEDDVILFEGSHDGYLSTHGMVHKRRLLLDREGLRLVGRDEIGPPRHTLRLAKDTPFAVHFHLDPAVLCDFEQNSAEASERNQGDDEDELNDGEGRSEEHHGAGPAAPPPHDAVLLTLPNGELWRFDTQNSQLSIEDSVHFAEAAGPRVGVQIVLRSASFGDSQIVWRLERVD